MEPTNTQPPVTNTPPAPASNTAPAAHKHHILAPIMIVLVLVVAALLVIGMMRTKQSTDLDQALEDKQSAIAESDTQTQALSTQGTSNDPSDIEADLKATNIDGIDQ